jgi:DNA repair exonuclease SbcCD ATPase subunit
MDLAQSILKELITLQNKNEELARIIGKLEHESDVIIQQFEHKIEELQKGLKHEQDDKSRAARRYEEEIRELKGSKDALIREINEIRETFQGRIASLEGEVSTLTTTIEVREKDYSDLIEEKQQITILYEQEIISLKKDLTDLEESTRQKAADVSSQIQLLTDTLVHEKKQYSGIIQQKEEDIRKATTTIASLNSHIRGIESRKQEMEEESQQTINHLHHLINTERQIRTRELRERDELVKSMEQTISAAEQDTRYLKTRLQEENRIFEEKITQLNSLISEALIRNTSLEEEIRILSSTHAIRADEYKELLRQKEEEFNEEHQSLQKSVDALREQCTVMEKAHDNNLRTWDDERGLLTMKIASLKGALEKESIARQETTTELTRTISTLESEKTLLSERIIETQKDQAQLFSTMKEAEAKFEEKCRVLEELQKQKEQITASVQSYQREIIQLKENLVDAQSERDQISAAKQQREDYFYEEIARLNSELSDMQTGIKSRENVLIRDIAARDKQIAGLSLNNEALRAEVDRVRIQYGKLQETIRAEKDESVHALYRDIASLEDKLTGKDTEIASLSERLLRLDAENTRLLQNLAHTNRNDPVIVHPAPLVQSKKHSSVPDPRKRDVEILAADLEDPPRAAEAAEKLIAMGSDIVELLIPLLHTGSIQRRVWIAVILYELNDNRATLPLMKLLETPKVHFRELIWEAKNQFKTHMRMSTGRIEPVSIKGGPGSPGYNKYF